jgi:hypothetical protein
MFNLMLAFPKLRTIITPGSEEILYQHVFFPHQPSPQGAPLIIKLPDPFCHKTFIKDLSVYNPNPQTILGDILHLTSPCDI